MITKLFPNFSVTFLFYLAHTPLGIVFLLGFLIYLVVGILLALLILKSSIFEVLLLCLFVLFSSTKKY